MRSHQHRRREHLVLAWHIEALQRTRQLPLLRDLLGSVAGPPKPQTSDEIFVVMSKWRSMMAGVEAQQAARRPPGT